MLINNIDCSDVQYVSFSNLLKPEQIFYREAIFNFLWRLTFEYAGFRKWYNQLFSDDSTLNRDREIIICLFHNRIAGVSILKNSKDEKKICTLRVAKEFQKNGIGKNLIIKSMDWLETDTPLITVHSSKAYQFEKLFRYFGFKQESMYKGYYSLFSTEIAYNGVLPDAAISLPQLLVTDMRAFIAYHVQRGHYTPDELFNMYLQHFCECFAI